MRSQDTSLEAYDVAKLTAGTIRAAIYSLVATHEEGMTCEELERFFPEKGHQSISARVNELRASGHLVHRDDMRRMNRTGSEALVLFFVPAAEAVPVTRVEAPIRTAAKELHAALRRMVDAQGKGGLATSAAVEAALAVLSEADRILHPVSKSSARKSALDAAAAMRRAAAERLAGHPTSH